ncbi:Serpin B4 like protein [Argiope bruennichi]|uniref:Serpin B4 like protein n=1 Tax=Argiope bruennichi TaxID=94029 RepID=A0A8T0EIM9_ARGBR|nr:Serpin B4 like protein [Argiope bruennichi]
MISITIFSSFFGLFIAFASAGTIPAAEDTENIQKLAIANNELAFNLHRKLVSNSSKNVFFSPLSISTAFGMLFRGARGDTAEELRNVLGYDKADLPSDLVQDTFNRFLSGALDTTDSSAGYVLKAANAIFIDKFFELLEDYRDDVAKFYKAAVRNVNFSTDATEIVEEINSWVREKTNGKIDKLFDDLSPSTLMVLLNAVYFKGTWHVQFNPEETTEEIFLNNGLESEAKKVPLMHLTSYFLSDSTDDYHALELPYKGGNVSMLILLPNEPDGLHALEDSLTPEKLADIQEKLERTKIDVSLPKFKLDFEEELSDEMHALGANQIFRGDADFSGMTKCDGAIVSEIRHKAIIEVNEEGSEAAAVTGVIIDRMKSPHFRADHPFFFAIVEKSSNMILFMGHVKNL